MWVKTPSGSLCNLSRVSEITVDKHRERIGMPDIAAEVEVTYRVQAWHGQPGPDEPRTILAEYATEEAAKRHMKGLQLVVGAKVCELANTKGECT